MTMPETTQSDLVERREALSFNLYLECAGLKNPSECFPVGGDFTSMSELLAVVEQAERDAFEITRLRCHCEALADAADNVVRNRGSRASRSILSRRVAAYRKEGGA